ncbi:MAG: C4-type zinc ribbon domain-containing protein [Bacteroidales bacterium]|jgi:predicted  nucleic acid-binding Zn-ribbon protein|nr:C4-type zinc ribbon domain-containing protein [Bacteroidales bacterium]
MVAEKNKVVDVQELPIEDKLKALYRLQQVHSEIDKINILRGELPLEVQDLEDEIAGLHTRIKNFQDEIKQMDTAVANKKNEIVNAQNLIKKYQEQQNNVRNNREFDSLSKEIEFQTLEIELCEKRIREFMVQNAEKQEVINNAKKLMDDRRADLKGKQSELSDISSDTEKEEQLLVKKAAEIEAMIEPRLINAYKRIRSNARNGLAVVTVQRDACGGCFANIPPQRQLDIRSRRKVIVCEYCGRILVDNPDEVKNPQLGKAS